MVGMAVRYSEWETRLSRSREEVRMERQVEEKYQQCEVHPGGDRNEYAASEHHQEIS